MHFINIFIILAMDILPPVTIPLGERCTVTRVPFSNLFDRLNPTIKEIMSPMSELVTPVTLQKITPPSSCSSVQTSPKRFKSKCIQTATKVFFSYFLAFRSFIKNYSTYIPYWKKKKFIMLILISLHTYNTN
jgi:hypothetical protein